MKERFINFIKEQNLFTPDEKILLTISGGIDSMTMLHLFMECNFSFSIAHCNFQLRGAESDDDQEFVQRYAHNYGITFHLNKFDTMEYAEKHKISVQMAARELRYGWFERLAKENNYNKIATAHNSNDVIETFFINLTRGTGIHGLTGIKATSNNLIRPLLFAPRKDILEYAEDNNISYREDSSNSETKYLRNAIRHDIIPIFEKLNPAFLNNALHTTNILSEAENVFNKHIKDLKNLIINRKDNFINIDISAIQSHNVTPALLYEILSKYDFNFDTATRMIEQIHGQPGACYYSKTHKIVKDRTAYILYPLTDIEVEEFLIEENSSVFTGPLKLNIQKRKIDESFELFRSKSIGIFDASMIKFPLTLRRWKHGDTFYPFGMRGKKKLSDYFTDQKISILEKENIWLLCSGNDIIWIVNHRTDNRYRITNSTKEVVQIELID